MEMEGQRSVKSGRPFGEDQERLELTRRQGDRRSVGQGPG